MAGLWLLHANSGANATRDAINAAPSGMGWLSALQHHVADAAQGNGLLIASTMASLSAAIGIAVAANWRPKLFLALAIILNLAYGVIGQGLGGIFTGAGTDPNAAPPLILLALAVYSLTPIGERASQEKRASRVFPGPARRRNREAEQCLTTTSLRLFVK
jgi:hypothetical protein